MHPKGLDDILQKGRRVQAVVVGKCDDIGFDVPEYRVAGARQTAGRRLQPPQSQSQLRCPCELRAPEDESLRRDDDGSVRRAPVPTCSTVTRSTCPSQTPFPKIREFPNNRDLVLREPLRFQSLADGARVAPAMGHMGTFRC